MTNQDLHAAYSLLVRNKHEHSRAEAWELAAGMFRMHGVFVALPEPELDEERLIRDLPRHIQALPTGGRGQQIMYARHYVPAMTRLGLEPLPLSTIDRSA
jgi:non-ribosomal peptide synthetase component F